jgi:hypothetical protein
LKAGFHLVEIDTRNLRLDDEELERLVDLAKEAEKVGDSEGRITRFSPNLSVPGHLAIGYVKQFLEATKDPVVIKVDGGLDGISSCQAIRTKIDRSKFQDKPPGALVKSGKTPIITCYPLLRETLGDRVTKDFFIDALALSGADIIYPGGRPNLYAENSVGGRRSLGVEKGLIEPVRRYHRYVHQGWPMPTVAGGIFAGELHSYYELLGPDVAFFLGGGVALHKDGPIAGAKLCAKVIRQSMSRRAEAGNEWPSSPLSDDLIKEVESAYKSKNDKKHSYVNPGSILDENGSLASDCLEIHGDS